MRDWSNISPKSFWGKLLRLPFKLIPKGLNVRVMSGPCKGMRWIVGSSIHGCWLGTYELEKQSVIQRFVRPGMIVYDIGANAGFYTLLFSRLVGKDGRVYSFEPFPENTYNLLRHIQINHLDRVTLLPAALAEDTGISSFRVGADNAVGSLENNNGDTILKVPTLTLDTLIARGYPIPDLVKMDVEGAEALVLEGAKRILAEGKTTWFIALHGRDAKLETWEILSKANYRIFLLDGTGLSEVPDANEIYALPAIKD